MLHELNSTPSKKPKTTNRILFTSQGPCLGLRKSSTVLHPWCLYKGSASFSVIASVLSEETCSFLSQRQVLGGKKNLGGGVGNKELVSVNPLFFDCPWVVTPGKAYLQFSAERKAGGTEHVFVGQCLGGGNGNPFQYSCLENPMDSGAWWATAHGVIRSWMWLSDWACRRLSLQNCFRCFAVFTV